MKRLALLCAVAGKQLVAGKPATHLFLGASIDA